MRTPAPAPALVREKDSWGDVRRETQGEGGGEKAGYCGEMVSRNSQPHLRVCGGQAALLRCPDYLHRSFSSRFGETASQRLRSPREWAEVIGWGGSLRQPQCVDIEEQPPRQADALVGREEVRGK
jgi:hypothetical protein